MRPDVVNRQAEDPMALNVICAGTSFASWLAVMTLAAVAWKHIRQEDTQYADKLFTPGLDQAIYRLGPLSWKVLYLTPPPASVRKRVAVLRIAVAVQLLAFVSFVATLVWSFGN